MFRLVYSSQARSDLTEKDLEDILSTARTYNGPKEISGVLMFGGGMFLQLLEGKATEVQKLFNQIQKDPRHTEVELMLAEEAGERLMGEWAMAYTLIDDDAMKSGGNLSLKDAATLSNFVKSEDTYMSRFLTKALAAIAEGKALD